MKSPYVEPSAVTRLLILTLLTSLPASAQESSTWVEGYFQLFVERVPDRPTIVALVEEDGRVLLPLRPILRLTGIPLHRTSSGIVLEWPPESWRTVLDPVERTFEIDGESLTLGETEWVEQDGETYLVSDAMGRLLNASITVDMVQLTVTIRDGPVFPSARSAADEARRRREQARSTRFDPTRFDGVPYPARTGGFAAGWSVALSELNGLGRGTVRPMVGAGVLGGGAELGVTGFFQENRPSEVTDVHVRYQRVLPTNRWVRQVEAGTILSRGLVARPLVGASITNEPFTIPRFFDETLVTPAVPAGWEYEVYQGQHLVGVSTPESPSEIRAPLNYGSTPVRVRMVGPAGQEVIQDLVYLVPHTRVPVEEWRYSVGGGACDGFGCDAYGFAEVGHGLTRRITLYAGADYLSEAESSSFRPWARLGFSPTTNASLSLQSQGTAFLRGDVQYYRGRSGTFRATYTWAEPGADPVGSPGWTGQASASMPTRLLGGRWLYGRIFLRGLDRSDLDAWQGAVSTNLGLTNVEVGAESGLQIGSLFTARVFQTLLSQLPWSLRDAAFGGGFGAGSGGIELFEASATVRTRENANIDLRFRARKGLQSSLSLGVTLRTGLGLFRGRGAAGSGAGLFLGADGGVAYGPDAGALPLAYQSVGRSGVTGSVFYDLDGDGLRGADEPPAQDATVVVGGWRAATDTAGHFLTWELTPYEGTSVSLDTLTVDPEWVSAESEILLRPSPNLFTSVSVALHRTRELIGSVVTDGNAPQPVAGAGIEIVATDSGVVVLTERTFSDGVFYVQRLRPGRYTVRLLDSTAAALGLASSPTIDFEIPIEAGRPIEITPMVLPVGN